MYIAWHTVKASETRKLLVRYSIPSLRTGTRTFSVLVVSSAYFVVARCLPATSFYGRPYFIGATPKRTDSPASNRRNATSFLPFSLASLCFQFIFQKSSLAFVGCDERALLSRRARLSGQVVHTHTHTCTYTRARVWMKIFDKPRRLELERQEYSKLALSSRPGEDRTKPRAYTRACCQRVVAKCRYIPGPPGRSL